MTITSFTDSHQDLDFAQRLRAETTAVRLRKSRWGVTKSLDKRQKQMAADPFGAAGDKISASKKLVDTKHERFRAVTAIFGNAGNYWQSVTVPFPEDGIRLIRTELVGEFDARISAYQSELDGAVAGLDAAYDQLRRQAQHDLGGLFNPSDYPGSLAGLFSITVEYPSVEPDQRLRQLNPALYEREQRRIAERFDEAVRLAEEAFLSELSDLVDHLCERITGDADGQPKRFKDSAVGNLVSFFQRFRQLNIGSNESLDALVEQAQSAVQGVTAQRLRDSEGLRRSVRSMLSNVAGRIDEMMVDRPRRAISLDDE